MKKFDNSLASSYLYFGRISISEKWIIYDCLTTYAHRGESMARVKKYFAWFEDKLQPYVSYV